MESGQSDMLIEDEILKNDVRSNIHQSITNFEISDVKELDKIEKNDQVKTIAGHLSEYGNCVRINKRAPLVIYSREEVKKHNTKEDCWVIVDNKVYNVTSWISRHPGGEVVILSVAGQDITDGFLVNHMPDVREKILPLYQIGFVKELNNCTLSNDFCNLQFQLEKDGWYLTSYSYYAKLISWYSFLLFFSLFCVFFGTCFFVKCVISACSMAMFWQQIAFLGHDLGHMSVTHSRVTDNWIAIIAGNTLMGISIGWWKATHNLHHIVTNYLEHDPDIQHLPVFAVTDKFFNGINSFYHKRRMEFDKAAQILIKRQHLLFYPVMFFARFNLYLQSILLLTRPALARTNGVKWPYSELTSLGLFYLWYSQLLRYFDCWYEVITFLILSHGIAGILHLQICLSHFSMEVLEPAADGAPLEKMPFAVHQLKTSLDVDCWKRIDWFHGGLQFQATHHLFPMMPRHRLRELSESHVRKFCEKHCISYNRVSFWEGNKMILNTLKGVADRVHPWFKSLIMCEG